MKPFLNIEEVAAHLGVAQITVRRWIKAGKLPAIQPGGRKSVLRVAATALQGLTETAQSIDDVPDRTSSKHENTKPAPALSGSKPRWQRSGCA